MLKKIIPILLLCVISINHLNIIDAIMQFSMGHSMENSKSQKDFPKDEETEKGCQEKEKGEDQVKYYSSHHHLLSSQFQLSANDKFVCFNTALNKHPYKDDDIQPPKAV